MSDCQICDAERLTAIDEALDGGRHPNLVRAQFRLDRSQLQWHIAHRAQEAVTREALLVQAQIAESASEKDLANEPLPDVTLRTHRALPQELRDRLTRNALLDQPLPQVTENPLSQLKQAWQLAKDDRRMRQAMVAWINEQLQADDMGLP